MDAAGEDLADPGVVIELEVGLDGGGDLRARTSLSHVTKVSHDARSALISGAETLVGENWCVTPAAAQSRMTSSSSTSSS